MKWLNALTIPQKAMIGTGLLVGLLFAIISLLYAITDKIADGGEAIGRQKAQTEQKEKIDEELQARYAVRDCYRSGRVWLDDKRQCVDPVPAPRK
jgi:hypothetical protein